MSEFTLLNDNQIDNFFKRTQTRIWLPETLTMAESNKDILIKANQTATDRN